MRPLVPFDVHTRALPAAALSGAPPGGARGGCQQAQNPSTFAGLLHYWSLEGNGTTDDAISRAPARDPKGPRTPGATRARMASPPVVAHGHRDVVRAQRALGAPVWPFSGAPCAMGCKSPHGGSAWPRRRRRARPGVRERGVEGALSECTRQLRKSSGPPMLAKVLGRREAGSGQARNHVFGALTSVERRGRFEFGDRKRPLWIACWMSALDP